MGQVRDKSTQISALKGKLMTLVQSGDFKRARELCGKLCKLDSRDAESWFLYGAVCGQLGELSSAVKYFRKAITLRADVPTVYVNLGMVHQRLGEYAEAESNLRKAIELSPQFVQAHLELGNSLLSQGLYDQAIASYREVLRMSPGLPVAHVYIGNAWFESGNIDNAIEEYSEALALDPSQAPVHYQLGICASKQGRIDDEIAMYRKALSVDAGHIDALNNLGLALEKKRKLSEAASCYQKIIGINPDYFKAHINLGLALQAAGKVDEAEVSFREAVRLAPEYAEGHYNLGRLLYKKNKLEETGDAYRRAIEIKPNFPEALLNLGNLYVKQGEHLEGIGCFRKALECRPGFTDAHSNILFTLNYILDHPIDALWDEHVEFCRLYCDELIALSPNHENIPDSARKIRIGYVSADFRMHATSHFLEPVLQAYDRSLFEVYCYANQVDEDEVTKRFISYVDGWRAIYDISDQAVADMIVHDGIDILVDLSGHTNGGRLLVFARKPAPVQVTWLGYINTTGLDAIDYRIVDSIVCPPGMFEAYHSESLVRMPDQQWCYMPPAIAPDVSMLPALKNGFITFASVSNNAKISDAVLDVWLKIVGKVENSRLLLLGNGLKGRAERVFELADLYAVDRCRIEFVSEVPFHEYLDIHSRIDINLDAFPYCGGATTCHSLWMGVPMVVYAGNTVVSRGSASLLNAVGLDDFIAYGIDSYMDIAVRAASDIGRLSDLRSGMRKRVSESSLVNADKYVRDLECLYREFWAGWCNTQ